MIDISIVMATYNRGDMIERAIKSALNQANINFELVIVDDGSTDNTKDIIKNISDNRIKYFYKKNGGQASARNYGIKKALGKYIMFLDDDDEFVENALENVLKKIQENNSKWVYCSQYISVRGNEEVIINRGNGITGNVYKYLLNGGFLGTGEIFEKELFEEAGYFDEDLKIYEDKEVRIRIAKLGYEIECFQGYIYKYYENNASVSSAYNNKNKRRIRFYYAQKKIYEVNKEFILKDRDLYEYWMMMMRRITTETKNYKSSIYYSKKCLNLRKNFRNIRKYLVSLLLGMIFKDNLSLVNSD